MHICSVHYWLWDGQVSTVEPFLLYILSVCLVYFVGSVVQYPYIYDYCVFLKVQTQSAFSPSDHVNLDVHESFPDDLQTVPVMGLGPAVEQPFLFVF